MDSQKTAAREPVPKADLVQTYTTIVSVAGIATIIIAALNLPHDSTALAIFSALVAIAELGNVELFRSSRKSSVSVSLIVDIGAILALGPLAGVLIQVASGLMTTVVTYFRQRSGEVSSTVSLLRRSLFNIGMFVLSSAAAGEAFYLSGGNNAHLLDWENVIPLLLAVTIDSFVNLILLMIVISIQSGEDIWSIWKKDFEWSVPINIIGGIIGGSALALAYQFFGILGASVFFLPVFTIGYSYRLYADNMRDYINRLELLNDELNESNIELFETLSAVIDAYDVFTFGHSSQVAVYAGALSRKLGLPDEQREQIVKAALVHDIGKIGVSDTLIGKQGPLTESEYATIRQHPVIGAEILNRTKVSKNLMPLVRSHHEHYDGSGYPDHLKGDEIPLGSRILALADCLDAMLSDRPYREISQLSDVVAEILRNSGSQFDPQVVKAFLEIVAEQKPEFFCNSARLVDHTLPIQSRVESPLRFLKKSLVNKPERP